MKQKTFKEEYVLIGGIEQYFMYYEGKESEPCFLFLHGGPGQSEAFIGYKTDNYAERNYTMVYYDQRGAGKTYRKNKSERPSIEQIEADLLEAVIYVKKKFNKDKIGIIGHSWGTVIGSCFALAHPEHVSCYIGCGQVINIVENERVGFEKLREAIEKAQNARDFRKLESIGEYPPKDNVDILIKKMGAVRSLQGKYKLAAKVDSKFFKMLFASPVFGLPDLIAMMVSMPVNKQLMNYLLTYDLVSRGTEYDVPVYYLLGENDQQTPIEIAIDYFDTIKAPQKELFIIPDAGHLAMLDNTKEYRERLIEIAKSIN